MDKIWLDELVCGGEVEAFGVENGVWNSSGGGCFVDEGVLFACEKMIMNKVLNILPKT